MVMGSRFRKCTRNWNLHTYESVGTDIRGKTYVDKRTSGIATFAVSDAARSLHQSWSLLLCHHNGLSINMDYPHLKKTAPNTEKVHSSSESHWLKFLATKDRNATTHPVVANEAEDLLNQFATYLVVEAKKLDGEAYNLGSVLQYLSGAKEKLKRDNPTWTIWLTHSGPSFSEHPHNQAHTWFPKCMFFTAVLRPHMDGYHFKRFLFQRLIFEQYSSII